jgi:hypothetical protein
MTRAEFEAALRKLTDGAGRNKDNIQCVACERCESSSESTFCKDSTKLVRCHFCERSTDCTECSHCIQCTGCLNCQRCVETERCTTSAYLVRCIACSGCTYCFGCVGLHKKDFHILNVPYERTAYFEQVRKLARELRVELP